MAKVVRIYFDNYTEIAKSEEGYWFKRTKVWNNIYHQYTWTKWNKLNDLIKLNHEYITYFDRSGVREKHDFNYIFDFGDEILTIKYEGFNSRIPNKYRVPSLKKYENLF